MNTSIEKGIKGIYKPYCWGQDSLYSFEIVLNEYFSITGKGFACPNERDRAAEDLAEEMGVILASEMI